MKIRRIIPLLFAGMVLLSLLMHLPVMRQDLTGFHVWRQTQTQNSILSFAFEDSNILNPRRNERGAGDGIFRMEFPLMQWLISWPVRWGALPVPATRIAMFVIGILTMAGTWLLARRLFQNPWIALAAPWLVGFSPLFYYYTVNPLPDMMALMLAVWSILLLVIWRDKRLLGCWIGGWMLLSLAALVKLPFILYAGLPGWWWIFDRRSGDHTLRIKWMEFGLALLIVIPFFAWYLWVIPGWDENGITRGILSMNEEQRSSYLYYLWYFIRTTFPEVITGWPALMLLIGGAFFLVRTFPRRPVSFYGWMMPVLLFMLLVLFELNMLETVHDYYFMPLLPFAMLAGIYFLNRIWSGNRRIWIVASVILLLIQPVYSYFRMQPRWERTGFNTDLLTFRDDLRHAVEDDALVLVGNDPSKHIFLYYVGKKGWVYQNDWLTEEELKTMIRQGCRYIYSDSRAIDENPAFTRHFGTEIDRFGSVRVFSLQLDHANQTNKP